MPAGDEDDGGGGAGAAAAAAAADSSNELSPSFYSSSLLSLHSVFFLYIAASLCVRVLVERLAPSPPELLLRAEGEN